jgi:hypothetical protein
MNEFSKVVECLLFGGIWPKAEGKAFSVDGYISVKNQVGKQKLLPPCWKFL